MSTRIALGFVFSLSVILQVSQDYPSKAVRMIEPFGAGGGLDLIARAVSPKLSDLSAHHISDRSLIYFQHIFRNSGNPLSFLK